MIMYCVNLGGKVLVYLGSGSGNPPTKHHPNAWVIDLLNEDVECDDYAAMDFDMLGTFGGRINDKFLFCGGLHITENFGGIRSDKCYIVGKDNPVANVTLSMARYASGAGVVLPNNTLFVAGNFIYRKTCNTTRP